MVGIRVCAMGQPCVPIALLEAAALRFELYCKQGWQHTEKTHMAKRSDGRCTALKKTATQSPGSDRGSSVP